MNLVYIIPIVACIVVLILWFTRSKLVREHFGPCNYGYFAENGQVVTESPLGAWPWNGVSNVACEWSMLDQPQIQGPGKDTRTEKTVDANTSATYIPTVV